MRYRKLTPTGDYAFGQGQDNFLIDSSAAVAQAVQTRMTLWTGQWFLDLTDGTPWTSEVLGRNTQRSYKAALRLRIMTTPGVTGMNSFSAQYAGPIRQVTIEADVSTQFSASQPVSVGL